MEGIKNYREFVTHTYKEDLMYLPENSCSLDSIYLREIRNAIVISLCK